MGGPRHGRMKGASVDLEHPRSSSASAALHLTTSAHMMVANIFIRPPHIGQCWGATPNVRFSNSARGSRRIRRRLTTSESELRSSLLDSSASGPASFLAPPPTAQARRGCDAVRPTRTRRGTSRSVCLVAAAMRRGARTHPLPASANTHANTRVADRVLASALIDSRAAEGRP